MSVPIRTHIFSLEDNGMNGWPGTIIANAVTAFGSTLASGPHLVEDKIGATIANATYRPSRGKERNRRSCVVISPYLTRAQRIMRRDVT